MKLNGCVDNYGYPVDKMAELLLESTWKPHVLMAIGAISSVAAWKLQVFGPDINGFVVIFGIFQFVLTVITAFVATTDVFIPIIRQNLAEYRGKKWPKYDFNELF